MKRVCVWRTRPACVRPCCRARIWRRRGAAAARGPWQGALLSGGSAVRGTPDRFATDDELDAAILLAASRRCVAGHRTALTEAFCIHSGRRDLLLHEIRTDRFGAAFREALVVVVAADAVGVSFDLNFQIRMRR